MKNKKNKTPAKCAECGAETIEQDSCSHEFYCLSCGKPYTGKGSKKSEIQTKTEQPDVCKVCKLPEENKWTTPICCGCNNGDMSVGETTLLR